MKTRKGTGILFIVLLAIMLGYIIQTTEAFQGSNREAEEQEKRGPQRCGVGLPPCRQDRGWEGVRCVNGYCKSDHASRSF